jgi:hypothetical protein
MNPKKPAPAVVLYSISSVGFPACENIAIPEYRCEIPPGLAVDTVLTGKDGSEGHHDGHAIYRRFHAEGWHGMMLHYMRKGNARYSPEQGQEWEIMIFAWEERNARLSAHGIFLKDRVA